MTYWGAPRRGRDTTPLDPPDERDVSLPHLVVQGIALAIGVWFFVTLLLLVLGGLLWP